MARTSWPSTVRGLDVRVATGLAEAALVEGQDAVAASRNGLNDAASFVREPPQPWLCRIIGTWRFAVAAAGWKIE